MECRERVFVRSNAFTRKSSVELVQRLRIFRVEFVRCDERPTRLLERGMPAVVFDRIGALGNCPSFKNQRIDALRVSLKAPPIMFGE